MRVFSEIRYIGTKEERMSLTNVPAGSRFFEVDTRKNYENNGSDWYLDVGLEAVTGGYSVITTDHKAIHDKEGFAAWHQFAGVSDASVSYVTFKTGPNLYVHLKQYESWINNAKAVLDISENPDSAVGGAQFMPAPRHRITPKPSEVVIHAGSTVTLGSALHADQVVFGGGGANTSSRGGGSRSLDMELVLKPDTTYVFRLTNQSGVAADIWLWLFWYEEESA